MLSPAERAEFAERGLLVRRQVFSTAEIDILCERLARIVQEAAQPMADGRRDESGFWETLTRSRHAVEVFWDPERRRLPSLSAAEWESYAIRVGHGLHLGDPVYAAACRTSGLTRALRDLVPEPVRLVQSAVIYKHPGVPGHAFELHQDSAYLTMEPDTLVGAFVALDETNHENGGLELVEGSHREGLSASLRLGAAGWEPVGEAGPRPAGLPLLVPLERGSVIFFHGRTWHGSSWNRTGRPRRALIVHAMGGRSRMLPSCWLQEPEGGFASCPEF